MPIELLGRSRFPPVGDLTYLLTLPGYGFYWFLLADETVAPAWHDAVPEPMPDLITLILSQGWGGIMRGHDGRQLVRDVLPPFIANQRWFASKDKRIDAVALGDGPVLRHGDHTWLGAFVDVTVASYAQRYFLPISAEWDEMAATTVSPLLPYTLSKVRRANHIGALVDASTDPNFARAVLDAIRSGETIETDKGRLVFRPSALLDNVDLAETDHVGRMGVEQSNTSILLGETMVLKIYRRVVPGIHPEVEIGRFLSERTDYQNVPDLYGTVEYEDQDGTPTAVAVLQEFIRNQGDGWGYTIDYLVRELEELALGVDPDETPEDRYAVYLQRMTTLGVRTAALHRTFAMKTGDPAFDPEPMAAEDWSAMIEGIRAQARTAEKALRRASGHYGERVDTEIATLLQRWSEVGDLIDRMSGAPAVHQQVPAPW